MNPIQKAWLRVLSPLTYFVNDKLAKKSGLLGRLGRFYSFGPRQYGYHPSTKMFKSLNNMIVEIMPFYFHHYSFVKSLSPNGHTFFRPHRAIMLVGMISMFATFIYLIRPTHFDDEEGTTLYHLRYQLKAAPINGLENRQSAHYTEINNYYQHEMAKKLLDRMDELAAQRNVLSAEVKKTKYARPGYKYIQPHSKFVQKE